MKILITGANGFLGSWLCKVALSEPSNEVYAAIRKNANTSNIDSLAKLKIIELDYSSTESINLCLDELKTQITSLDLIIHNAGLTKSTNGVDFSKINKGITERLIQSLFDTSILSNGAFSYISSQAALGPVDAGGPISEYGKSKLEAEKIVSESGLNYLIFRPTGIYGPGDKEFLPLFKSVKSGFYPCAAPINQKLTLIHAFDVALNILNISSHLKNKTIHLSDGNIYSHKQVNTFISNTFNKTSFLVPIPQWLTRTSLYLIGLLGKMFRFEPFLTVEKHQEISKDWDHDFSSERKEIPLEIKFDLKGGFVDTSEYYLSENLL